MAITYFNSASNPADGAAATGAGPTVAVTPPASMTTGDLVYVTAHYRGSAITFSLGADGGQSWSQLADFSNNPVAGNGFWCRYNGTWSADPSFTASPDGGGTVPMTVVMHVFRPSDTGKLWKVGNAQQTSTFTAGSTPFTKSRTGQTTTLPSTVTIATFASGDDNTWGNITGTGWVVTGSAQYRNTTGGDQSIAFAHKIQTSAGATGTVTLDQLTLGGDAGASAIITFAEYDLFTKDVAGTTSPTGALAKKPARTFTAGTSPTGALLNQPGKKTAGATSPTGALIKAPAKRLTATPTPSGALTKQTSRSAAGATAPTGALTKRPGKLLAGGATSAGSLLRTCGKALAGATAPAGAIVRSISKLVGGTATPSGTATKLIARTFAGAIAPVGSLTKRIAISLAGVLAPVGALVKLVAKLFGGGVAPSGALGHSEFSTNFVAVTVTVEERNRVRMTEIREDNAVTMTIEERERVMLAVEEED